MAVHQRPGIDPHLKATYRIEIEGLPRIGFSKCDPEPQGDSGVAEYREGDDPLLTPTKQPGLKSYNLVTLERGSHIGENYLAEWWEVDNRDRRTVDIVRLTTDGEEDKRWKLIGAWLKSYKPGAMDAQSEDEVAVQSVEIAYDRCVFLG